MSDIVGPRQDLIDRNNVAARAAERLEQDRKTVNRIRLDLVLSSDSDVADEVNKLLLCADKMTRRVEELEAALREIIDLFDIAIEGDDVGYAYEIASAALTNLGK